MSKSSKNKMLVMCGLSGVGKSTFAQKLLQQEQDDNLILLNVDDFYAQYNGNPCDYSHTFEVWINFYQAIHAAEIAKKSVIVDTNTPNYCARKQYLEWFPTFDEYYLYYLTAAEELRYANNNSRNRVIPANIMEKMREDFESPLNYRELSQWNAILHFHNENNKSIILRGRYAL